MIVRMNTFLLWQGQECLAGEEIDLPKDVALAYVNSGQAEYVSQFETATIAPATENAALRTQGKSYGRVKTTRQ